MESLRIRVILISCLAAALTVGIFAVDLQIPLGVAGGVPYVAVVLLAWWLPKRRHIIALATVASVLTVAGYFYSPLGGIHWMVVANRGLALFAIWITAILLAIAKTASQSLRESEERFRHFTEASSDYYWEMDENLKFSSVSSRFTEVTGFPVDELLGKTREETGIPGVDPLDWEKHLDDLRAHRPFSDFVHPRTHPNGKVVWLSVSGKPGFDADGDFLGYRGTGIDITERRRVETHLLKAKKEAEKLNETLHTRSAELVAEVVKHKMTESQLLEAKEEAETNNNAKSEFLAAMSHDLRTPLNAILGFSDMMRTKALGPLGNVHYEEYANDIYDSGLLLVSLINDVLDLSKIEAGKYELVEEPLDVSALIQSSIRQLANMAKLSNLTLSADVPSDMPSLLGDERALIQILNNLLSNAIKFTLDGGKIGVSSKVGEDNGIVLNVLDTGIGMSEDGILKALKPFEQADGTHSRRHEGTGLGLHLCVNFMQLFGGTFDIKSEVGKGTMVTVRFPPERTIRFPAERTIRAS